MIMISVPINIPAVFTSIPVTAEGISGGAVGTGEMTASGVAVGVGAGVKIIISGVGGLVS